MNKMVDAAEVNNSALACELWREHMRAWRSYEREIEQCKTPGLISGDLPNKKKPTNFHWKDANFSGSFFSITRCRGDIRC